MFNYFLIIIYMSNFPKELNLGSNKPMGAMSKPSINRYRSDNSTYTAGDTIKIEIATGRSGQYIFTSDSFLEGRVSLNYTTTAATGAPAANGFGYVDQSVYSLFNRMRIIHGSTVIEDMLFTNRLWTVLYDLQVNEVERRQDTITKMVYDNTASTAYQSTGGLQYNNHLAGALMVSKAAAVTEYSRKFDFSFCLPSSVVGLLCSKALPVGLMGASSLYIELELAPVNVAFVGTIPKGATTNGTMFFNNYLVEDIYFNAKMTTLPSDVNNALIESTGGIINIPGISYKCEAKTLSIGQTQFTDKFSFQFSSIKTFLFWFTNTATAAGGVLLRSISSRPKCNLNEYYLTVNGEAYPSQSIGFPNAAVTATGNTARMYCELLRSFDSLSDTNAGGIINIANYSINDVDDATDVLGDIPTTGDPGALTLQKRFVGGIDLDRFNHSSDILMSGTSTIGQMVNLNLGFGTGGVAELANLYAAVMYDVLYHIEGGQMLSKF